MLVRALGSIVRWGLAWWLLQVLWVSALLRVDAPLDPGDPAWLRWGATLGPPLVGLSLGAWVRRRRAARRAALEQGAVTTTSGYRFLPAPGTTPREAVIVLAADPRRLDAAEKEYVAQVHVPRGDRASLRFGARSVGGLVESLEVETALAGREVVYFDVSPLALD
jgi:hypothetical protein